MQKPVSRRAYIAIDLKSFYASVECVERGLDPLTTNLVAALSFSLLSASMRQSQSYPNVSLLTLKN